MKVSRSMTECVNEREPGRTEKRDEKGAGILILGSAV